MGFGSSPRPSPRQAQGWGLPVGLVACPDGGPRVKVGSRLPWGPRQLERGLCFLPVPRRGLCESGEGRPGASACLGVQSRVWTVLQAGAACPSVCLLLCRPPCCFQDPFLELDRVPSLWSFPRAAAGLGQQGHWVIFVCSCYLTGAPRQHGALGVGSRTLGVSVSQPSAAGLCNVCLRCRARADRLGAGGSLGECDRAPPHTPGCGDLGGEAVLPGQPQLSGGWRPRAVAEAGGRPDSLWPGECSTSSNNVSLSKDCESREDFSTGGIMQVSTEMFFKSFFVLSQNIEAE